MHRHYPQEHDGQYDQRPQAGDNQPAPVDAAEEETLVN